ncbi:MAG: hypothetical protein AAF608_10985 [Pseudomonadota bacterium]
MLRAAVISIISGYLLVGAATYIYPNVPESAYLFLIVPWLVNVVIGMMLFYGGYRKGRVYEYDDTISANRNVINMIAKSYALALAPTAIYFGAVFGGSLIIYTVISSF